ncbi:uncharacterized protein LAJ45_10083 [Morchella importuna]|uniref:uncharacterized protein n=1 Tax=Morchella importuna TaxID=1174673 RepID=UPI001E8D3EF4|nr:uncharacterized protein LAJ45_10083 [Morchella importuna]KAH8145941.1 hypothetical protein LAJ45_10083 [Morchella importuna]
MMWCVQLFSFDYSAIHFYIRETAIVVIDTVAKNTMADIPPGYAVLSRVDYKNTVFNQFVCPIEEIATYKGLKAAVLFFLAEGHDRLLGPRRFPNHDTRRVYSAR